MTTPPFESNWSYSRHVQLPLFSHTMNNTTLEYDSASSTVKVLFTLHFITIQIVGNLLWVGIIHFEKWGSDPQKRDLSNQLISFACQLIILLTSVSGTIAYIRIITSVPIGKVFGTILVLTRQYTRICGILVILEYLVLSLSQPNPVQASQNQPEPAQTSPSQPEPARSSPSQPELAQASTSQHKPAQACPSKCG
jgi:hypothetical protein